MLLRLTDKQKEFWNNCSHRWNIKCGATRSGKTFLDYFLIPKRLLARRGKSGLNVMLGNTKSTLQRNIIEPLQELYGNDIVSDIKSDNTAVMFGEKVHCIGADKINQVDRIRGSSIKYCYGDEIVTWSEEVFNMLKSRLDKPYSVFDGTCNPDNPTHWVKRFIDSDADIFYQEYTIYDNIFLDKTFVKNLEKEYAGTVYFDRYILGKWVRAEGIIFRKFADNPEKYMIKDLNEPVKRVGVGYDLGGNKSNFALVATGITVTNKVVVLKAKEIIPDDTSLEDVEKYAKDFIEEVEKAYKCKVNYCYVDDNYYTTVNSLNGWRYIFDSATHIKARMALQDRPLLLSKLMAQERFKMIDGACRPLKTQLENAVYDERTDKAVICDDGSMNIDCIDAFFYSIADDYLYLTDDLQEQEIF